MEDQSLFLRLPHVFKPLQVMNAVILMVCVASTSGAENGILWFVIIVSFLVSLLTTVIFVLGAQDSIMEKLTNGTLQWNVVEMVYSFMLGVFCAISIWVSFGFANHHIGGTSAGFIATGLFLIVQTALYAVPCVYIYDSIKNEPRQESYDNPNIEVFHPISQTPYQ